MIVTGVAVRKILWTLAAISLSEGVIEMFACHFGFMRYHGNHALVFGVPISSLVQNAGMFTVIGVALAALIPTLHGWRWLIVPLVPPLAFMAYVMARTPPNFYAIQGQFAPVPFWAAAILSTALNAGVAIAALYTDTAKQYRRDARTKIAQHSSTSSGIGTPLWARPPGEVTRRSWRAADSARTASEQVSSVAVVESDWSQRVGQSGAGTA
jgi:hypothetical protein